MKVLRNQGLLQTLEKFQFLHTWIFFQFVYGIYGINLKKIQVTNWKKKILRFEADLKLSRPSFSEIKVQIKWLWVPHILTFNTLWNAQIWSYDYTIVWQCNEKKLDGLGCRL